MAFITHRRLAYALLSALLILLPTPLVGRFSQAVAMSGNAVALEPGRIIRAQPAGLFYSVDVDFSGPRRVETKTWFFMPGQRVSRFHPFGGTFELSRCNPDTCGSYQIGAGKLTVRWDGGGVSEWTFATTADGITLDRTAYRPARAVTAASLVGQWSDGSGGGSNVFTFDSNGRFSFGAGSDPGLTGSYRVEGFTLTLAFADGDTQRRTLFAASAGEPAGMISVDARVYARR